MRIGIKMMELAAGGAAAERVVRCFRREVEVMSRVRHRNVVSLLGACATPLHLCLLMELVQGGSLEQALYGSTSSATQALLPLEQVCTAAAASRGCREGAQAWTPPGFLNDHLITCEPSLVLGWPSTVARQN